MVMTIVIDHLPEPDNTSVARRIRMHMGDKKITRAQLALASGIKRPTLTNKLDDRTAFTLDEIIMIAHALGKSWLWVLTGNDETPPPEGPDGGASLPRLGSNQEPSDYWRRRCISPVLRRNAA